MAIVKMKKLRLLAVRAQRDSLIRELMRLGCVELREPEEMLSDPETAALFKTESSSLTTARTELAELERALNILDRYVPAKKPLLSARPLATEEAVLDEAALQTDLLLAERIVSLDENIRRCEAKEAQLRSSIEALRPWESLDFPLESSGTRTVAALLGSMDAEKPLDTLADAAEAVSGDVQIIRASSDAQQHCVLVLCMKSERDEMLRGLQEAGFVPASFPGLTGTARQNIRALEKELRAQSERKAALTAELEANAASREELKLGADRMALVVERAAAVEKLQGTETVVALEGWLPAEKEEKLQKLLEGFDCAWETAEPTEEEYPEVPVKLKNNKFTSPLNMVTNMYSLPAYGGVDPNPLMAPFFILFYGIMMADMGYGLLMMLGALIVFRKMRPREGMRNFAGLLAWCGASTFVLGAITGGFFGDFIPQLLKLINPESGFAMPALFNPIDDAMMVLIGSLALGIIHIFTGMAVSMAMKIRRGQWMAALFQEGAWYLVFLCLGIAAVTGAWGPCLLAALAVILLTQGYGKKGVGGILAGIGGSLYNNITGYFSDILSYSRLMALMLAGAVIAQVFNTLGAVTGHVVTFVLISMVGNALNFALNILGCYVHDMRLQCLEYFGRFYEDGGKAFRPLAMKTEFVDIQSEKGGN